MNVLLYRVLWGLGVTPWERRQAWAKQVYAMLDREEQERRPPYGAALDLGWGTGIWAVDLADVDGMSPASRSPPRLCAPPESGLRKPVLRSSSSRAASLHSGTEGLAPGSASYSTPGRCTG